MIRKIAIVLTGFTLAAGVMVVGQAAPTEHAPPAHVAANGSNGKDRTAPGGIGHLGGGR